MPRSRTTGVLRWFPLVALFAPACSLIVSLDDLGSPSDASTADAVDGMESNDGGGDVVAPPADASSPCTVTHTFCEDFNAGALPEHFDSVVNVVGTVSFDTSTFVSPSRSMLGTTHATSGPGTGAGAYLTKTFNTQSSQYTLSFWFRVDSSCFSGNPDPIKIGQLQFAPAGVYALTFVHGVNALGFTETTGDAAVTISPQDALDVWHHLTAVVSMGPSGAGNIEVDDAGQYFGPLGTPAPSNATDLELVVGALTLNVAGSSNGCIVAIDDVALDIK